MAKDRPMSVADWGRRFVDNQLPWDSGKPDVHPRRLIEGSKTPLCKVLEVGCGTGTKAILLAELGFEVVGRPLFSAICRQTAMS